MSERIWIALAAVLLIVAAVFVWRDYFSGAFVAAALGACAWFLSYRSRLRDRGEDEQETSISIDEH